MHRKGAAPGDQGFMPCPGSHRYFTWVLSGIGGRPNEWCAPLFVILQFLIAILMYSIAHSLPHGPGRLHILRPPGYPAPDLTTASLNSHVICTDPQLLIEERPEAYKPIRGVVDDVEEKRIAECVAAICDIQGWGSDGKRVECQGTREGEGCVDLGSVSSGSS